MIYVPSWRAYFVDVMAEMTESASLASIGFKLLGAADSGLSMTEIDIKPHVMLWSEILKTLVVIISFILLEKLIRSFLQRTFDRYLFLFVAYFLGNAIVSKMFDSVVPAFMGDNTVTAVISFIALILFLTVSAVLIHWIYSRDFIYSFFYMIFKVLFGVLNVLTMTVFSIALYIMIYLQNPAWIMALLAIVAFFLAVKFAEKLFCGKCSKR